MSRVLVNGLQVRTAPSVGAQSVAHYDAGQVINSGVELVQNEGRTWLKYKASSGNYRYICAKDKDGSKFIDVNIGGASTVQHSGDSGWELTAYCSCSKCCGKSNGITASGYKLTSSDHLKICAAPSNIPFHTIINISGGWNGTVKVEDRGGAINGKRLDIYCKTHQEALQFGRKKNCTIQY